MNYLKMHSKDKTQENYEILQKLFPNAVTETIVDGEVVRAIDKDVLQQEINATVVEGRDERYQFTWPDKKRAIISANAPINKTLRPCREESVDFDNTENLYIEGDNLEVLKLLQETYLGKIKMIYIDPPYNTGHDFVYNDKFSVSPDEWDEMSGDLDEYGNRLVQNTDSNGRFHTDWLNMIYPRLKIARDLLSDDGVIFISIDDCELDNLRKVCDELFGENNFISNIVWQSTAGSNTGTEIVTVTENIIIYTKNRSVFQFDGMLSSDNSYNLSDEYEAIRGKYALDKLDRRRVGDHYSEALNYPITMPDGTLRYPGGDTVKSNEGWNYLWSKTKVQWGIENGFIVFSKKNGIWNVYNKRYAKIDNEGNPIERTIPFRNVITSDQCNTAQGTNEIRSLFGFRYFDFPKPSKLIIQLLLTCVRKDNKAIILDFFSGSATTAHAVMRQNFQDVFDGKKGKRKFIMVQLPEKTDENSEAYKAGYKNICGIGKERIRRAGELEKKNVYATAGSSLKWNEERKAELGDDYVCPDDVDIGFRVLKLDDSNMKDVYYNPADFTKNLLDTTVDNIKEDRTPEDLLFQVMLDLGVLLSEKIEESEIAGKKVFNVANGYLIACFDSNVNEKTITAVAKQKPIYFVMRDSSLSTDTTAANFDQIFETYSPDTVRKVI